MRTLGVLRAMAAGVLAVAAVNHAALAARGAGNVQRHLLFVGIDAALGALVALGPRWALPAAIAASFQQIPSHGADLVASLGGPIDWGSLGVVLFFPTLIILLAVERTAHTPERRAGAPPPP